MLKKALLVMIFAAVVFVFSGCNTVGGFGEDMKIAGQKLQKASQPSK